MIRLWFDEASFRAIDSRLKAAGDSLRDVRPAWRKLVVWWVQRASEVYAKAQSRHRPRLTRYQRRKASGKPVNGPKWGSERSKFGTASLLLTGRLRDALTKPELARLEPLSAEIGVDTRDEFGRYSGDHAYFDAVNKRFKVSPKLTPAENAEASRVVANEILDQFGRVTKA